MSTDMQADTFSVQKRETGPDESQEQGGITAPPALELENVCKQFQRESNSASVSAIADTSMKVADGEFVVLLGPSGCGKTTMLRSIAGLERPDSGRILINGKPVFDGASQTFLSPEERDISMIFQSYALWPHMTIFKNVAYPLRFGRASKLGKAEIRSRVMEALRLVGIEDLEAQYPGRISGGQQQRVALARALVSGSRLVLFDEPLSNVDAKVREQLRRDIIVMVKRLGLTSVYVTHDQSEALSMADRIAVIDKGRVQQFGSPREVYQNPVSRYVAKFIGNANEMMGTVRSIDGAELSVETRLGVVVASDVVDFNGGVGDEVALVWRPDRALLTRIEPAGSANAFRASVTETHYMGTHVENVLDVDSVTVKQWSAPDEQSITEAWLSFSASDVKVFGL